MVAAFYLLSLVGLIGAYDVLYWHWYRLRLFTVPEARVENLTHAIRALIYGLMTFTVLHVDARGAWWWVYPAVLAFEVLNTFWDVVLEPNSRRKLGGVPPSEYVIHVMLSILTGAALASIIWGARTLLAQPSYIGFRTLDVPTMPLVGGYVSIVIALAMFAFEFSGFIKLSNQRARAVGATASVGRR
jgi:hypothetical protein